MRCTAQSKDGSTCVDWAYIYSDSLVFDDYIAVEKSAIKRLYDDVISKCEKWNGEPNLDIIK